MKWKMLLTLSLLLFTSSSALAESIVKIPLGESGPDVMFDGTTFRTVDDGDATTLGDQNTRILFSGFGNLFSDFISPEGSFSLSSVAAVGAPTDTLGVIAQGTSGGTFDLYAPDNTLLLSGTLQNGAITGSAGPSATGSFFNTQLGTFTGGTLAAFFVADSAQLSIALNAIFTGNTPGLDISGGFLHPFTSDASGLITGTNAAVPEPVTGLLLLSGLPLAARMRRKKAE
ncbi:MAG: PEP-CTERM sorting domain-containing protein [Bdellovibrionota bacterium]